MTTDPRIEAGHQIIMVTNHRAGTSVRTCVRCWQAQRFDGVTQKWRPIRLVPCDRARAATPEEIR